MDRSAIIADRLASRGAVSNAVDSVSDTSSNVITALGVGFGLYLALQYVVPNLLGAATQTKRAARTYREAGGDTKGSDGVWRGRRSIESRPTTRAIVKQEPIDAQFIDD